MPSLILRRCAAAVLVVTAAAACAPDSPTASVALPDASMDVRTDAAPLPSGGDELLNNTTAADTGSTARGSGTFGSGN